VDVPNMAAISMCWWIDAPVIRRIFFHPDADVSVIVRRIFLHPDADAT
jgi:hypothetical protein